MPVIKPYLSALAQICIVAPISLFFSFLFAIASCLSSIFSSRKLIVPKTILITGSSSGIGRNLAEHYAKEGITLILLGRDKGRLQEIADVCTSKRARVITKSIDVTDKESMKSYMQEAEKNYNIDLVIANAGVNSETLGKYGAPMEDLIYELYDANITGVLNTVIPVVPLFKAKKHGQIAIVSSLMAYVIDKGPYSSSKACITHLGQGLRFELAPHNVHVSVIAPPYVPSKMTEKHIHNQPKMFVMEGDAFAALVQRQLEENRPIVAPFVVFSVVRILSTVPPALCDYLNQFRTKIVQPKKDN